MLTLWLLVVQLFWSLWRFGWACLLLWVLVLQTWRNVETKFSMLLLLWIIGIRWKLFLLRKCMLCTHMASNLLKGRQRKDGTTTVRWTTTKYGTTRVWTTTNATRLWTTGLWTSSSDSSRRSHRCQNMIILSFINSTNSLIWSIHRKYQFAPSNHERSYNFEITSDTITKIYDKINQTNLKFKLLTFFKY